MRIVLLLRSLVFPDDVILSIIKSDTFRLLNDILLDFSQEGWFGLSNLNSKHRLLFQSHLNVDISSLLISRRVVRADMQEFDISRAVRMLPWTSFVHRGPARGTFLSVRSTSFPEGNFFYLRGDSAF